MIHDLVRGDLFWFFQKEKKKRWHKLILNLGCPLNNSQYIRRFETAKNDENTF